MVEIQVNFKQVEVEILKESLMNYAIYMLRMNEDKQNAWNNIDYPLKARIALQIIRRINDAIGYNESGEPSKSLSTSPEGK